MVSPVDSQYCSNWITSLTFSNKFKISSRYLGDFVEPFLPAFLFENQEENANVLYFKENQMHRHRHQVKTPIILYPFYSIYYANHVFKSTLNYINLYIWYILVTSTYKEPMAGWIDNIYAINGVAFGLLLGFLRVFEARYDAIMDIIPVDMCISAMLSSAKNIAENSKAKYVLL